jgi:hypothetical protein
VDGARAELPQSGEMLRGAVALVLGKAVSGMLAIQFDHQTIARDFGEDAGGSDRIAFTVAFDDRGMRNFERLDGAAIDEYVLRGWMQLIQGEIHGAVGGLEDVDLIDRFHIDHAYPVANLRVRRDD